MIALVHGDTLLTTDYAPQRDWCEIAIGANLPTLQAAYREALISRGVDEILAIERAANITGAMLIMEEQWAVLGYQYQPVPADAHSIKKSWKIIIAVAREFIGQRLVKTKSIIVSNPRQRVAIPDSIAIEAVIKQWRKGHETEESRDNDDS